jgi:hypothetical protein
MISPYGRIRRSEERIMTAKNEGETLMGLPAYSTDLFLYKVVFMPTIVLESSFLVKK